MKNKLLALSQTRSIRYLFVGGLAYVVELSFLLTLVRTFHLSDELAVAYSFWAGLAVSFLLQKYIVFGNKERGKKALSRQTALYACLLLGNYIFTIAFVSIFNSLFGLVIARTVALGLTVTWNYFAYKRIFK